MTNFVCLKQGHDLENRAAHPHQEFPGVLSPPGGGTKERIRILPTGVEYSCYLFMCFTLQCTAVLYCFAPIYVRITLV